MRELTKYLNKIGKWTDHMGNTSWLFEGDGQGDFEQVSNKIPDRVLLENYLKDLRQQAEYVKELLEKDSWKNMVD